MTKISVKNKILDYIRLFRLQTAAATASAPLIGGLVAGLRDLNLIFILFVIGIFYHIYGFVLNEYMDVEVDKKSSDLKDKILVSGKIKNKNALLSIYLSCIFACLFTIIFFQYVLPLLFLLFALFLGGVYDVFGKKIPGLDFVLGGSFFFLCLMGASTVSSNFTPIVYIVCSIYFIHISFNNSVEGGLKDVDHDNLADAKTLATIMNVTIKKNKLNITKSFAAFSIILKIVFFSLIFLLCIQPEINISDYILQLVLILFFAVLALYVTYKFLKNPVFVRSRLKILFSVHEMSSYFILVIALSPLIELWPTVILIFLPFFWYISLNFILYGKLLQPQV